MASVTLLLSPKESDAASFVASSAVSAAAVGNLKDQRPRLQYQSTTTTPNIVIDAGVARAWNTIILGYFNSQSSDTFRLRAANSEANLTAAPGYDSDTLHPSGVAAWPAGSDLSDYCYPHRQFLFIPGASYRWWRVDFGWGANTDGYVRGGRLMLGTALIPATSAGPGWESGHTEPIVETEDIGGGQTTRPRGARRWSMVRWPDGALTKAEGAAIQRMMLERGSARDMALCIDTSETEYPMSVLHIGRVKQDVVIRHVPRQYRTTGLTVTELAVTEMR